jgi:dethiobiotin synthetase
MKPAATGCAADTDGGLAADDAAAMLTAASSDLPPELVAPYRYRSPLTPLEAARTDGVPPPDFEAIDRALSEIARRSDSVLVEDTHGLATLIDATHDFADLALAHHLDLILVVGVAAHRPDFADAARRALEFAAARGVSVRGAILNALDRGANDLVAGAAEELARATGASMLGTMRFKEPLSLAIVERLL